MASIELIKASDGSGNANVATVQSSRSPLASTIIVDTVLGINADGFAGSMGTPHTFVDPVTSETITVISEATAVDFTGHVDGSNLEIDDIAPGYTDNGSEVGDIIIIRPTTQYADNLAETLEVAHNDDGTLKDNSVDAGVIADNAIDSADLFTDPVDPVKRAVDQQIFDYVVPGGVVLTGTGYGSTLAYSLTSGVVYINGKRLTFAGATGSVSATKDTYFDLLDNSDGTAVLVNTGGNIVTVNAASPALAANSVRVGIIQSGANIASVAAVNQGQEDKVLPIASSIPYCFTDSLGNIICPRDPNRRVLGYRQLIGNVANSTLADVTGLSSPVIVPTGRKVKVIFDANSISTGIASGAGSYQVVLADGSNNQIAASAITSVGANFTNNFHREAVVTPAPGAQTYKVRTSSTSLTVTLNSAASAVSFIRVELI